jgi:hypothetical protein
VARLALQARGLGDRKFRVVAVCDRFCTQVQRCHCGRGTGLTGERSVDMILPVHKLVVESSSGAVKERGKRGFSMDVPKGQRV